MKRQAIKKHPDTKLLHWIIKNFAIREHESKLTDAVVLIVKRELTKQMRCKLREARKE